MSFWTLIRAELWRRPERTIFTMVSLAVGFLLFGLLQSVNNAFGAAEARSHGDRLIVSERFGHGMPLAYLSQIEAVTGVTQVALSSILPTFYRDPKQSVLILPTSPRRFFSVFDEYKISATALERLIHTQSGLVVFDRVAKRFGWRVGDRVNLIASVPARDGSNNWTFDIVGTMTNSSNSAQVAFAVMNDSYMEANKANTADPNKYVYFFVKIADPRRAVSIARSIDRLFVNSAAPTQTQPESAWAASAVALIGDVKWLTDSIMIAVFVAMLFLTANVMMESVRERTSELAVLKTFGYSDFAVLVLIELEALAVCLSGAIVGLALAEVAFHFVGRAMARINDWLTTTNTLSVGIILAGVGFAVALTLIAAAIPAWRAKQLDIVDALRVRA